MPQPILPITDEEIASLRATKNASQWNAVCDKIKKARNGQYPGDWWPKVMASGLNSEIQANWSNPSEGELRCEPMSEDEINSIFGRTYTRLQR